MPEQFNLRPCSMASLGCPVVKLKAIHDGSSGSGDARILLDGTRWAAHLLGEHGSPRRSVTEYRIKKLEKELDANWEVTHQGAAANSGGIISDGYHRLTAMRNWSRLNQGESRFIWLSGPFSKSTDSKIDVGRPRTPGQFLHRDLSAGAAMASAASYMEASRQRKERRCNQTVARIRLGFDETIRLADEYHLADYAAEVCRVRKVTRIPAAPLLATVTEMSDNGWAGEVDRILRDLTQINSAGNASPDDDQLGMLIQAFKAVDKDDRNRRLRTSSTENRRVDLIMIRKALNNYLLRCTERSRGYHSLSRVLSSSSLRQVKQTDQIPPVPSDTQLRR